MSTKTQWMYRDHHWFRLPIALRQRWWKETDYGRNPASMELVALIETQVAETQQAETQQAETQQAETQQAETQAAETQAAETQAAETQAAEETSRPGPLAEGGPIV